MATALLDDELWRLVESLLPVRKRRFHHPGRKRLDDRRTLSGILLVLRTGIAWQPLPQELGYGSGITCWRRLNECNRQVYSRHYTSACLPSFLPPGALTSPGLSATPPSPHSRDSAPIFG
ncbi:MAG: transposase [Actinobacteria bacterium]|nr:transposase [Actinomycetota bacterium]